MVCSKTPNRQKKVNDRQLSYCSQTTKFGNKPVNNRDSSTLTKPTYIVRPNIIVFAKLRPNSVELIRLSEYWQKRCKKKTLLFFENTRRNYRCRYTFVIEGRKNIPVTPTTVCVRPGAFSLSLSSHSYLIFFNTRFLFCTFMRGRIVSQVRHTLWKRGLVGGRLFADQCGIPTRARTRTYNVHTGPKGLQSSTLGPTPHSRRTLRRVYTQSVYIYIGAYTSVVCVCVYVWMLYTCVFREEQCVRNNKFNPRVMRGNRYTTPGTPFSTTLHHTVARVGTPDGVGVKRRLHDNTNQVRIYTVFSAPKNRERSDPLVIEYNIMYIQWGLDYLG